MPRRKLYRERVAVPDAKTLATYLLVLPGKELYWHPDTLPRISSCSLFDNERAIELEIGCGSGDYLCSLAHRNPEVNFVGVDLRRKSLYEAVTQASAMGLENILFMQADARLLRPLLVTDSLRAVYLHFPDPITRPKFHNRRLLTDDFLDAVHRALKDIGKLSVISDHRPYFDEMLQVVERDDRWHRTHEERFLEGFDVETRSRFQRIWEGHGLTTLRFEVQKRSDDT